MRQRPNSTLNELSARQNAIKRCKRIIVKVGSRLLSEIQGYSKQNRIDHLVQACQHLRENNFDVILVSSGAISTGMELTKISKRPRGLSQLQALAAVGQSQLMSMYENACSQRGFNCAQILLSYDDLKSRKRHLYLCNCLNALLRMGVLPIINENDTVSVDEISFGDNDKLAALVATMTHAELTILLTTVQGLLNYDKKGFKERISLVREITPNIRKISKGTDNNHLSTGGMSSKIEAAEICMAAGECLWIADGKDFSILSRIINGEDLGTLFYPTSGRLASSKRWLAFFTDPLGDIMIDNGAKIALESQGKSLLPIGIIKILGEFEKGDTVSIKDEQENLIGTGITNYKRADLEEIKGMRSSQISEKLGRVAYDEAIHRDNLVLL